MGLGMARGGTVVSSVPVQEDEQVDDALLQAPEEEEIEEGDEEQVILDEAAQTEGYASHAEKQAMEATAGKQGWRPLAQYRGIPGGWKSAKQFIEDGQNYLPFVQKELRETKLLAERQANEMEGLRTEMATTRQDMQKLLEFSRKASKTGYDKAIKDLEAKRRQAAVDGDVLTYDQVGEQIGEMHEAREEVAEPTPAPDPKTQRQPAPAKNLAPEIVAFVDANPWFNKDALLNAAMIDAVKEIEGESPAMPLADQLDLAKERLMEQYPKKFGLAPRAPAPTQDQPSPRQRQPQPPLAPRGGAIPTRSKTGIDAIADAAERAAARQGYNRMKASFPDNPPSEDEYLQIFNDPHADVLDVLRKPKK